MPVPEDATGSFQGFDLKKLSRAESGLVGGRGALSWTPPVPASLEGQQLKETVA